MKLTYRFQSPHDLLEKLRRERERFSKSYLTGPSAEVADHFWNFVVTAYHVKDWLKKHSTTQYTKQDVESYVKGSVVLSACRDLCNAGKHFAIDNYTPVVTSAPHESAGPQTIMAGFSKIKVPMPDGTALEALALTGKAITEWEQFFQKYGL